jgi:hypothetical protein
VFGGIAHMPFARVPVRASSLLLIFSMGYAIGCGVHVETPEPPSEAEENLSKIGRAYMQAGSGLKRPPRNAKELLHYLEKNGDTDQVLRSPRDGQEYVILWDVKSSDLTPKPVQEGLPPERRFPVLAHEKIGEGGSRFVLQVPNRVVAMTNEELREAYFPAGHRPPR